MEGFRESVGPVVCCAVSAEVDRICKKNAGLGFCDLLSEFASLTSGGDGTMHGQLTFRSASKHFTLASGLSVRFVSAQSAIPMSLDRAEATLRSSVVHQNGEAADLSALLDGKPQSIQEELSGRRPRGAWFARWRTSLEASLRYGECDSFDCPAVLVLAASSSEPAGLSAALEELGSPHHLAPALTDGHFDERATPRHVLVLHDVTEGLGDARAALSAARASLPSIVGGAPTVARLLNINSLAPGATPVDLRFPHLDATDLTELRRFASELIHGGVVPAIERRVASLFANINSSRKGVRNVLKSWLRRPREAASALSGAGGAGAVEAANNIPHGVRYHFETIEAQIRLLADTTFAMRDYDTALSMYRLARDDFKSDRALLHLGCANEMIARCLLCLALFKQRRTKSLVADPRIDVGLQDGVSGDAKVLRRDAISAIDAAMAAFVAAADEARTVEGRNEVRGEGRSAGRRATIAARMLTRAALVASECRDDDGDGVSPRVRRRSKGSRSCVEAAADALVGAAQFETNLNAAVLYEQAAWRYQSGGFRRKCALHLVMAGHRYRACGAEVHAVECYVASKEAYAATYISLRRVAKTPRAGGWARIDEHVEHALGRQLETLGYHALALRCTLTLLGSARAPAERHAQLLSGFIAACIARPDALAHAANALRRDLPKMEFCGGGETSARVVAALESLGDNVSSSSGTLEDLVVVGLPLPFIVHDAVVLRTADELVEGGGKDGRGGVVSWARDLRAQLNIERQAVDAFEARPSVSIQCGADQHGAVAALRAVCVNAQLDAEKTADRHGIIGIGSGGADRGDDDLEMRIRDERGADSLNESGRFESRPVTWPRWVARGEAIDVDVVFHNAFATPVELSNVHLVCTFEDGTDFSRRPNTWTTDRDVSQDVLHSSAYTRSAAPQLYARDPFLVELSAAADKLDVDPNSGLSYVTERVHVTLPPGVAGGLGGAMVRLRCGVSARNGTLRIVGVRWKLGGKIWGAMAFLRRGACLRRTREERASNARAPDASLAVHVVGDMPRVVARVCSLGEGGNLDAWRPPGVFPASSGFSMLDGEVRRGTLELANVGRAAASDLFIRCNLPWVALGRELRADSEECDISVRHSALGTSGLSWRAVDVKCSPMVIRQGESASLPIFFRAHGKAGETHMQILIQYSPLEKKMGSEPPRCWPPFKENDLEADDAACWAPMVRDLRATDAPPLSRHVPLSVDVNILPSLALDVIKVVPKFNRPAAHHLSMTLTNCRADEDVAVTPGRDLRVTTVNALGDGTWQLHDSCNCHNLAKTVHEIALENTCQRSVDRLPASQQMSDSQVPVDVAVRGQEQLALHYTVQHGCISSSALCAGSDINLEIFKVEQATMQYEDQLERARSARLLNRARTTPRSIQSIRREAHSTDAKNVSSWSQDRGAKTQIPTKPVTSILPSAALEAAVGSKALALVIGWASCEANSSGDRLARPVSGQHHVLSIPIGGSLASYKEIPKTTCPNCPISLALDFATVHVENIGTSRATVPVTAVISNTLGSYGNNMILAVEVSCVDDALGDVCWCGQTKTCYPKLTSGAKPQVILLQASISCAGVFDLGALVSIKFATFPINSDPTHQTLCDALSEAPIFSFKNQFLLTVQDSSSEHFCTDNALLKEK